MPLENDPWHLKKHDNGEVFGPVPFSKIVEWAGTAQIAPQDALSSDGEHWTKAPMVPELKMDWIVRLEEDHFYGPTTIGSLLEFREAGEIGGDTVIIDCCTATEQRFKDTKFYVEQEEFDAVRSPSKGAIRLSLQKRIRDLEMALLDKRRQLDAAAETIRRLELHVSELESRHRGSKA
ncbi:MAG TPA: hypothetical protein VNB29_07160 [Chthoniobacterales bacterium]|nr:hypothetical protein [Chthoniobacterales bacterium]